jgi:hypothetical protein
MLLALLGSKSLARGKRCAEGIVRVLSFDFAFWQAQNPQNFHIGRFCYCQNAKSEVIILTIPSTHILLRSRYFDPSSVGNSAALGS